MSTRPVLNPQQIIVNGDMSQATITSAPTILGMLTKFSYQAVWSAGSTPVGTIALQVSDDYKLNATGGVQNVGTWTTVVMSVSGAFVTSVPVSGNSGSDFIDAESGAYAVRIVYTRASGSGTLNAYITAKVG